jgi:hypothetical protein
MCEQEEQMKKLALLISILVVFTSGTSAWASLYNGSLSTPLLYDSAAYPIQPQSARTPIAAPGGLSATAAWNDFGMRLDWSVTQNANNTFTYHYYFGPGWYPPTQPTSGSGLDPYVTNKQINALDIQLGSTMTMADISNATWNVYQFDGQKVGSGTATNWANYVDPDTGNVLSTATAIGAGTLLNVKDLVGATGHRSVGYNMNNTLFHGIQWLMPIDPVTNAGMWNTNVNFDLTFTSTYAPGLGNFFANSNRTGSNNDYSEVVAFDGLFDATGRSIASLSNAVTVAGGAAPVPIPPSVLLFGSGLSGLFFFRRKKIES